MATRDPARDPALDTENPSDEEFEKAKKKAKELAIKLVLMSIDSYLKALAIDNLQDLSVYTLKCFGGVNLCDSEGECLEKFERRYKYAEEHLEKIMQDNQENSV